jgi:metal-dependent amidase/aminoacylase/carboxypeptidase family protein
MHACGHDGHTAMLLARRATWRARHFNGTLNLIFQPAEEGLGGARDDGRRLVRAFPCDAIFAMHNMPGTPRAAGAARRPGHGLVGLRHHHRARQGRPRRHAAPAATRWWPPPAS